MPIVQADFDWAKEAFALHVDSYATARNYYAGKHELSFTSAKFSQAFGAAFKAFAYNRCRPVVDAMANKLRVKSFSIQGIDVNQLQLADLSDSGRNYRDQAMTLWRLAGMDIREGELYVEAGTTGDAYAVVYWDAPPPVGTGLPRLYPNRAELMRVRYDDDGRIVLAVKQWLITDGPDKNKRRITFYTPNEIYKYITADVAEAEMPKEIERYQPYQEVNALGQPVANPIVHNLGQVPVIHYPNNAPMLGDYGISELRDVIPLQDALNKAVADMLVAMEYSAFQQRWAIGIDPPEIDPATGKPKLPFKHGAGELWWTTDDKAKFGSFDLADLTQFIAAQDQFDMDIARVSQTPVHWLNMTGTPPSGESLKVALEPWTAKLQDRQRGFGAGHAQAVQLFFRLLGITEPLAIQTEWELAEPRNNREQVEIGKMMVDAGIPLPIAARAMGLAEKDILELEQLEEERATSREQAMAQLTGQAMSQRLQEAQGAA